MQIINNLNNLTVDDQYFLEVPVPQGATNIPTGNIGLIGTFSRGPLNKPTLITSYTDLVKQFGEVDPQLTLTGTLEARGIFRQGNANVYVVRIDATGTPSTPASVVLKDTQATPGTVFTLNAISNGTWGNSLIVITSAGSIANTFNIQIQYGAESETWTNVVAKGATTVPAGATTADLIFGNGNAGSTGLSNLATAIYPGTVNNSTWALGTFTMSGGTNGATTLPADYIGVSTPSKTGIFALDSAPVNLVVCAGQSDPTIQTALVNNAQSITQNGGIPRIAITTFPKGTAINGLSSLVNSLDSDRLICVYPWVQIFETVTNTTQTVSPLGYYAGLLSQLKPHLSTGNKTINGILGPDPSLNIGPIDLATLSNLQINAIGVTTPKGTIGVRGGFCQSRTVDAQLYTRRMKDYIDTQVMFVGGQYVDQPITGDLMRQVKQSVDNILLPLKSPASASDQMIADYRITCDTSNNTPSITAQNRLLCDYAVKLLNMNRFMIFRTQISAGVVITTTQLGQ
jgi:hypothetical protein